MRFLMLTVILGLHRYLDPEPLLLSDVVLATHTGDVFHIDIAHSGRGRPLVKVVDEVLQIA